MAACNLFVDCTYIEFTRMSTKRKADLCTFICLEAEEKQSLLTEIPKKKSMVKGHDIRVKFGVCLKHQVWCHSGYLCAGNSGKVRQEEENLQERLAPPCLK